jgi:hypothetical protein
MKLFLKKDTTEWDAVVDPVKKGNWMWCGVRVEPVKGKVK